MNAVQTDNNYRLALLDLSQLIELETPEGFLLEDPTANIELIPLTPPDEIFQTALVSKASIQAAQYRLEGSKHSIRIAQSAYYPQLSFSGSLGTNYYSTINRTFSQQMNDNFNKYVGFNLSVPDWPHATGYAQPACSAKTIPCSWITPKRASTKRFSRHGTTRRHPKASIRAAVRQHRPAKHPLS